MAATEATFPLSIEQTSQNIIVDMSKLDRRLFQTCRAVFVYFRNASLNTDLVSLDFSKLRYEEKCSYMAEYMLGPIRCRIKELDESWMKAIRQHESCDSSELHSIFTIEEQQKFAEEKAVDIEEVMALIKEAMMQLASQEEDSKDAKAAPPNVCNIFISYSRFADFIPWKSSLSSSQKHSFSNEQKKILIDSSKSLVLLYGQKTEEWTKFSDLLQRLHPFGS